jgi:hypothetical protein
VKVVQMKVSSLVFVILGSVLAMKAHASAPWPNCPSFELEKVEQELVKSAETEENGPDYQFKSGQVLRSFGNVCQEGKSLNFEGWVKELKTGLNQGWQVTSYKPVRTGGEFQKLLLSLGVTVEDPQELSRTVDAFLVGKPLKSKSGIERGVLSPYILAGTSKNKTVIAFVWNDGKYRVVSLKEIVRK